MKMASKLAFLAVATVLLVTTAQAQVNATRAPEASAPFVVTRVADFNRPWRIAFLTGGRML